MAPSLKLALIALAAAPTVLGKLYSIQDTYIGETFLDTWNFETIDDPTHGRVNYVNKETALNKGLVVAKGHKFIMRADSNNTVPLDARGRDSIRITSKTAYTDSVMVLDLEHMPEGCTTWPAFRTLSQASVSPAGGKIDVIEGVNLNPQNLITVHTTANCTMPENRIESGKSVSTNCDVAFNSNQGCGANVVEPFSFGSGFNKRGGGWYVVERSQSKGANVWFWSRDDLRVPASVRFGAPIVVPDFTWGIPDAAFPSTPTCPFETHFDAHEMMFALTFCGDWAGSDYATSGCAGSCVDVVNNDPENFKNAYWEINSLRMYTP